jgi:hypothetical protein
MNEAFMKEQLQIVVRKNRRSGDLIQIARKADKKKLFIVIRRKPILYPTPRFLIKLNYLN